MSAVTAPTESSATFACFGSCCSVIVSDARRPGECSSAVEATKRRLLEWHRQFSRFEPDSELARLNDDARSTVPVSPMLRRLVQAAVEGARRTGGLVDFTLGRDIERVGYVSHFGGTGLPLEVALALAPPRHPARAAHPPPAFSVSADRVTGTVGRPVGCRLDLGGIAKGVFADELASWLNGYEAFVVDCAGDLRLGGSARRLRSVHVASPFEDSTLHTFELAAGGVATSGIGKRSWFGADGRPAHHLLDPRTGMPAFTGIVQATALAPTAVEAEMLSKAALLSGPEQAARWLPHGGVLVWDDGGHVVLEATAER